MHRFYTYLAAPFLAYCAKDKPKQSTPADKYLQCKLDRLAELKKQGKITDDNILTEMGKIECPTGKTDK